MRVRNPQYRIKSTKISANSSRLIQTERDIKASCRSSSIESIETHSFLLTRPKISNTQYQQELTKVNKSLDTFEISKDSTISPLKTLQVYLKYLESISFVLKSKDSITANCFIRGVIGLKKAAKFWTEPKPELEIHDSLAKTKSLRENMTQTYEIISKEDTDHINEDILFIQNIVDKASKLKSEKIIKRLFSLYEDLSKLYTDIPTPTQSPEPLEVGMNVIGNKLGLAIKLIKNEIQENLSKIKFDKKKLHQSVQTDSEKTSLASLQNDKDTQITNLKRTLEHYEQQTQQLSESLNKYKAYSSDTENRYNETKIELIQLKNRLNTIEDTSKSLKTRISQLTEKLSSKSKKLQDTRKTLNLLKIDNSSLNHSVKQLKIETHNINILNKITEEKLVQIDSAWNQATGSKFVFENVSSIEVIRKYNLYNTEESENHDKSPGFSSRIHFNVPSPRLPGRTPDRLGKEEPRGTSAVIKPLILRDLKIAKDLEKSPKPIPQIPLNFDHAFNRADPLFEASEHSRHKSETLPIIIESKTSMPEYLSLTKPKNFYESFHVSEPVNKRNKEQSVHKKGEIESQKLVSNSTPRIERAKCSNIVTNLIRETNELSSPSSSNSPSIKTRPILSSLLFENEIIQFKARQEEEKIKNIEENTKEVQCNMEKVVNRGGRATTVKVKVKSLDPDAFDEETLESFRKMCEQCGIPDFDNLTQNLKMEIIKSLEGHDLKKCENECVHLRRCANLRYKARGIPYPIKTSTLNTNF